jgi:pyruvate formate lyase activating enzyme
MQGPNKGVIFDIQRFSVHDGPGIRTTVFMKGCSVRCGWCHNPESISPRPQLQYYEDRCIGCGKCMRLCPKGAHRIDGFDNGVPRHRFDRNLCKACGLCGAECFSNALQMAGREENVEEVMRQVLDDKAYYDESSGGVTLSGVEPVLQGDFCEALLKRLKAEGIHANLQTAGFYIFEKLERLLPYLDLIMFDIKGLSDEIFSRNINDDPGLAKLAVDNLKRLDETGVSFIVRTPCVSGVNDSEEEITAIARMLSTLQHMTYYELIPYHNLAKVKYDILGEEFKAYAAPSKERLAKLEGIAAEYVKVWNTEKGMLQ